MIPHRTKALKTRKELMQNINAILGTNHNWSRLNSLDLERLFLALQDLKGKILAEYKMSEIDSLINEMKE